jgi:NAD(P)-dependent dehydrogenase (short-subunit alcohol dehydrogenase family)
VTGASSGIGAALARQLAGSGARVGLIALPGPELEAEAEGIRARGGTASAVAADVGDRLAVRRALAELAGTLGPIDFLFLNAGIGLHTSVLDFSIEHLERQIRINLLGVAYGVEAALPDMIARRSGHLIVTSSLASLRAGPFAGGYSASKIGVAALFESLLIELRARKIPIAMTTLRPGFVRTPLTALMRRKYLLMDVEKAARIILKGVARRKAEIAFPWHTAWIMQLVRLLPAAIYDRLIAAALAPPPGRARGRAARPGGPLGRRRGEPRGRRPRIRDRRRRKPMTGKTCLVTGATSGIGLATAEALAARGARLVLVGRDPDRCASAVERVRRAGGHDRVESLRADLASPADVRRLAREVRDRLDRLDVLVNNAGGVFRRRGLTPDGVEQTLALNHLGYFVLTTELLDLLIASAPARVVNVASEGHRMAPRVRFDDPNFARGYRRGWPAYFHSKLANLLFTAELARRLEGTGVTANAVHPGLVSTRINGGLGRLAPLLKLLARVVLRSPILAPEQAAPALVRLAADPDLAHLTGRYFNQAAEAEPAPPARDLDAARRLWLLSEQLAAAGPVPA